MRYKSIPANPMEIAKIRMLLKAPTSINKMLNSGAADTFCYWTSDGIFDVKRIAYTGDFNKDYIITKKCIVEDLQKGFLSLDEIESYPANFLGTPLQEENK